MGSSPNSDLGCRLNLLASASAGLLGTAVLLAGAPACAQSTLMEEVIVTAQKREEKLRDVPIAIAAVTGDAMQSLGYLRPQDVFQQIPNVAFSENGGVPQLNIRGVQLYDFGGGNEPPVGYYVDEVYLGTMAAHIGDIFDVERVEVLKGPQGTLFGRNTTGGLAHWITKKPTGDFEGYGALQYGSYNQVSGEGAVSGPLSNKVRARAAFKYIRDDGWQKNNALRDSRFSADDNLSGRLHVDIDLSDDVELLLNVHGSRVRGQSNAVVLEGLLDPVTGKLCSDARARSGACTTALRTPTTVSDPKHVYSDIARLAQNVDAVGGFARVKARLGEELDLVSISAFEYVKRLYEQDADGSVAPLFYNYQGVKAKQFSQEVRVSGTMTGFKWIAGAFYFHDDKDDINFAVPQLIAATGNGLGLQNNASVQTRSWALYGQGEIDLADKLSVTLGGRYTDEQKSLLLADNFAKPTFLDHEQLSDGVFTYRGSLNYKPVDGTLIFASASKGFKSGAFKTTFALPGEGKGAGKETLYSYELGLKTELIPRRLAFNASVFYNDYKQLQILSVGTRNGAPGSFLLNIGNAEIYGLDADATFVLTPGLEGSLGVGVLHSKLISANPIYNGNHQAMSPNFRANGVLRYTPDLELFNGNVTLQVSGTYMDSHYLTPENEESLKQKNYVLLGSNISWNALHRNVSLSFFASNLLDVAYRTGGFTQPQLGFDGLFFGRPRTLGARLSYNW
ncbi:MAG: TonB-dependent receptor [Rhodospirillales bacterium]|nr:TonB-dependent receptor [Rhodospirillales bacterium]